MSLDRLESIATHWMEEYNIMSGVCGQECDAIYHLIFTRFGTQLPHTKQKKRFLSSLIGS